MQLRLVAVQAVEDFTAALGCTVCAGIFTKVEPFESACGNATTCAECEGLNTEAGTKQQRPSVFDVPAALDSPTEEWCASFNPAKAPWLKDDAASAKYLGEGTAAAPSSTSGGAGPAVAPSSSASGSAGGSASAEAASNASSEAGSTSRDVQAEDTGAAHGLVPCLAPLAVIGGLAFTLL
jgi:hypothetical protein